ncbi:uncharacterized protein IUM83_03833 [Phytophthora cinnamomi]|uniref:uncharacterized protein n=1 Tax=Phytophthora cinnamomi TaxID=4785 RepID=UPI00355986F6|nr:hypothetical protein IUM83_03833 [Phytophthora cinnamomi]
MQLVKTLAIVTVATMMCFAPTAAIDSIDVKENTPEERKLYYVRTPITKSPYNRLVKTLAIAAVATMMCFAPTAAIDSIDVKENTPEERKLYYVRTPITKSPYNRVIPPPPPIQH